MTNSDSGSVPAHAGLSAEAVGALRRAVQVYLDRGASDGDILHAVRLMCLDVHRDNLRAEQLIIAFKEAWHALPEVQRIPRGGERERLLERIVTLCVQEYYSIPPE
jgi:hypothetical protein